MRQDEGEEPEGEAALAGNAMGSTTMRLTTSRPKNRKRWRANARSVPSTSAMPVAESATPMLRHSASWAPVLWAAARNHRSVTPSGGRSNRPDFETAVDTTTSNGR